MSLGKNYIYNLLFQFTVLLFPIISIPYATRILGPKELGTFAYTNSILQYFLVFAILGISIYGQKEISKIKNDRALLSKTFFGVLSLNILCSLTVFILLLGYIFFFAQYKSIFLIQSLILLCSALDISWFYQGLEKFHINLYRNVVAKTTSILLLFLFVKKEEDLWIYTALYVGSIIVGNVYMWFGIKKYITFIPLINLSLKKHFNGSVKLFYILCLGIISINLSKTVVGSMISMSELGKYDIIYKLITITLIFSTNIGTVLLPRMAYLFSINDQNAIQSFLKKSINISSFISIGIMFGLIAISKNLIALYLGSKFEDAYLLLYILAPMIFLNTLSNVFSMQYMIPTNQEKKYTISLIVGLIVGIFSLFILTSFFSTFGACMSVIIGEITILFCHMIQLKNDLNIKLLLKETIPNLISGVGMFIVVLLFNLLPIAVIPKIIVQMCCGLGVYILINFFLGNRTLTDFVKGFYFKITSKFRLYNK
jgi:O-antigen/teichoic acid export membrane protein